MIIKVKRKRRRKRIKLEIYEIYKKYILMYLYKFNIMTFNFICEFK